MNSSLQEYLRCITECSTDVKFFPLAYSLQFSTTNKFPPKEKILPKKLAYQQCLQQLLQKKHKDIDNQAEIRCYQSALETHDDDHFHHPLFLKLASEPTRNYF